MDSDSVSDTSAANLVLPNFSAVTGHVRNFADTLDVELDKISNLAAVQDGARWVQLSTRVDGHEGRLTEVQGTVTVTQGDIIALGGDFTALRDANTTLRDDNTTLRAEVTTLRAEVTTLRRDVSGMGQNISRFQGDMRSLREEFLASREQSLQLSRNVGSLSTMIESINDRLIESTQEQADARIRLEALNKNTVARFHNRLNGSGSDNLEPLYSLGTGRKIEDVTSRSELEALQPRRMTAILGELEGPRQLGPDRRRVELRKLYGA
ncbi:hypothetical protein E4U23_006660 [Claviceps purpurea]|nr:hypothetical protein E4U23_006660 [Claviceps purpurea]